MERKSKDSVFMDKKHEGHYYNEMKKIEKLVCDRRKLTPQDIRKRNKKGKLLRDIELVLSRQEVYCITLTLLKEKVSQRFVGAFFGQDHATALHGLVTISNYCDTDKKYNDKFDLLLESCSFCLVLDPVVTVKKQLSNELNTLIRTADNKTKIRLRKIMTIAKNNKYSDFKIN